MASVWPPTAQGIGGGGGGAAASGVSSVTNTDGTLAVAPNTGAVVVNSQVGSTTIVVAKISQKSEVGADASLLSYTPPAVKGTYRISVTFDVSAFNSATLGWTATWTDANGNAKVPTNVNISAAGVTGLSLTRVVGAAENDLGELIIDVNNSGTPIVVKTTFAGTSIAYLASAVIERLQ